MNTHLRPLAILVLLLSLVQGLVAQSTFTVTSTASTGTGTLDWAIVQAEFTAGPDRIVFDPSLAGRKLAIDFELIVNDDLEIDGSAAPGMVLSGGWDGIDKSARGNRLFILPDNSTRRLKLMKLILRDGNAGSTSNDTGGLGDVLLSNGGLIHMNGGTLELEEVILLGGTAHDGGLVRVNAGTLRATRSSFALGRARDDGGAVFVAAGADFVANNCTFADNVSGYATGYTNAAGLRVNEGAVVYAPGKSTFEHCTFAQNRARAGAIVHQVGELRLARNLFSNNSTEAGSADVLDAGNLRSLSGGSLSTADGNFSPAAIAGFNQVANERIRLAAPRYEANRVSVVLDCGSDLYGTLRSTGTDQSGEQRGISSEPGALETYNCTDTDADQKVDFADLDDDQDGMHDTTEHAFASRANANWAATLGTATLDSGAVFNAGGIQYTYEKRASGGNITVAGRGNVQGEAGMSILVNNWASTDRAELVIKFDRPVYGLSFKLGDLDAANTNLQESVDIQLEYEQQSIGLRPEDVRLGANVRQQGNRFSAINTLTLDGLTDARGNVELVNFPDPVTGIRFIISPGDVGGVPSFASLVLTQLHYIDPSSNDFDKDGLPGALDLDTDADGLIDLIEAQTSGGFAPEATGVVPTDTDIDGVPDMLDDDSDDDGEADHIEGHDSNNNGRIDALDAPIFGTGEASYRDLDRDGLDDGFDDNPAVFGTGETSTLQGLPEHDAFDIDFDWRDDAANLGAFVWDDTNRDGIRTLDEPALAGVTLEVYRADDRSYFDRYVSDSLGKIFIADFGGFGPPTELKSEYYIEVLAFGGFDNPTSQFQGSDYRNDSDIDPGTMRSGNFRVTTNAPQLFLGVGLTDDPRPVDIEQLRIDNDAYCTSSLYWQVGPERDVMRYQVERLGSNNEWLTEKELPAEGRTNYTHPLEMADATYRLRVVQGSGASRATDTLRAAVCERQMATRFTVAPNPTIQGQDLYIATPNAGVEVELYDLGGRKLALPNMITDEFGELRLPSTALPRGVYLLRSGTQTLRLMIQ